jgi:hypothetical protein
LGNPRRDDCPICARRRRGNGSIRSGNGGNASDLQNDEDGTGKGSRLDEDVRRADQGVDERINCVHPRPVRDGGQLTAGRSSFFSPAFLPFLPAFVGTSIRQILETELEMLASEPAWPACDRQSSTVHFQL